MAEGVFFVIGLTQLARAWMLPAVEVQFEDVTGGIHRLRCDLWVLPRTVGVASLPSVLGRDIINLFEFVCDLRSGTVQLRR